MEVKFVDAFYEASETIRVQGKSCDITPYKKQGYNIQYENNGNWVLTKPAQIRVILKKADGELFSVPAKMQVLEFYGKKRISEKMCETFMRDAQAGVIKIKFTQTGVLKFENS